MPSQVAKSFTVLGVFAAVAAVGFGLFIQNSGGQFQEILKVGGTGAKLAGLLFVPVSLVIFIRSFSS